MSTRKYLFINFGVPTADWHTVMRLWFNLMSNSRVRSKRKKLSYMIVKMEDALIRNIQLTEELTQKESHLLMGIIYGVTRVQPVFYTIEESTGNKEPYNL